MTNRDGRHQCRMEFDYDAEAMHEPVVTKEDLILFMYELKEEGNAFFKDGEYREAWLTYSKALNLAMDLKMHHYANIDTTFLSSLFSNRAMCCLRQNMFHEAVQDSDWAIETDEDNIKAYYRKVLALKGLKKYHSALKTAEMGVKKQPSAFFKDLVVELEGLIKKAYSIPETSWGPEYELEVEQADPEPDSDWLKDTNVHVTKEYLDRKKQMPSKKKKRKKASGGNKQNGSVQKAKLSTTGTPVETDADTEQSGVDSEDNDLENLENFASSLNNIRKGENGFAVGHKSARNGQKKTKQPEKCSQEERRHLSPHERTPYPKLRAPEKSSKGKRELTAGQRRLLQWPICDEYEYRLACNSCFVKLREGINGSRYIANQPHPCVGSLLLVKRLQAAPTGWVKIRSRPDLRGSTFGRFKLCQQFLSAQPCRLGEARCTFCHNHAEVELWTLDRNGQFSIDSFIRVAQELNLYSTDQWRKVIGGDQTNKPYIPGMLYKDGKSQSCQDLNIELPYSLPVPKLKPSTKPPRLEKITPVRQGVKQQQVNPPRKGSLTLQPVNPPMGGGVKQQPAIPPMGGGVKQQSAIPPMGGGVKQQPAIPPMGGGVKQPMGGGVKQQPANPPMGGGVKQQPAIPPMGGGVKQQSAIPPMGGGVKQKPTIPPMGVHVGVKQQPAIPPMGVGVTQQPVIQPMGGQGDKQEQVNLAVAQDLKCSQHQTDPPVVADVARSVAVGAEGQLLGQGPTLASFWPGMTDATSTQPDTTDLLTLDPLLSSPVPQQVVSDQRTLPLEIQGSPKLTNPLQDKYAFKIVCSGCFRSTGVPGGYTYKGGGDHKCEENVLAMICHSTNRWVRVRERTNHRDFPGNYQMCDSITFNDPNLCKYKEERCSFAHNEAEKYLWKLDKEEKWNITEFIMQQRTVNTYQGYSVREIVEKHPGHFGFMCRPCFFTHQRVCLQKDNVCEGPEHHDWEKKKTLAHVSTVSGQITPISKRGFTGKTAFFKICKNLHFCIKRFVGDCRFAHSFVERDVWMLERDTDVTREQIVTDSALLNRKQACQVYQSTPRETGATEVTAEQIHCPFTIDEVCGLCFKNGATSGKDGNKDQCNNRKQTHSLWNTNRVYITMPQRKQIRPLPNKIPANLNFIICVHIRTKKRCDYGLGGPCQFAHSEEEIKVWRWMVQNNRKTLEQLYKSSLESKKHKKHSESRVNGLASRSEHGDGQGLMQTDYFISAHYCWYCGVSCNSDKQWIEHCSSGKHMGNVNSDSEHQWNHRQPPWGIPVTQYQLCQRHLNGKQCEYSSKPEMYNLCQSAHTEEELQEWKERYNFRKLKQEMAKQLDAYSYMDQLLHRYRSAESGCSVMVESLDGVEIKTTGEQTLYREDKDFTYIWKFEIRTSGMEQLQKVALLYNKARLHFELGKNGMNERCQFAHGDTFVPLNSAIKGRYSVEVHFRAEMFGSFNQWVVFDFDLGPVVVRKLQVEVGSRTIHDKVKELREKHKFDRWTAENRIIVPMPKVEDEFEKHLLSHYKQPDSAESVLTQDNIVQELNRHNYRHKMSKLIHLEEMTRHNVISSFNVCVTIELCNSIMEGAMIFAQAGELFARVPLDENLNEDTDAGELILTSVNHVLLAPQNDSKKCVYEAAILQREIGLGRNYIYLSLPAACFSPLGLKNGDELDVEIQFQLDRLVFCKMQYAVDQMTTDTELNLVFPNISRIRRMKNTQVCELSSPMLNEDQMSAVHHIFAEHHTMTPPLVIYGPFGTGKTETLAQATMLLLNERQDARILICTETNSAADLYIEKHLDPHLQNISTKPKLLRICWPGRKVSTVKPVVRQYCCLSQFQNHFVMPSKEEVISSQVCVITLDMSLQLVHAQMKGIFKHIFVDEAAQALECDAIKPLCLADAKTCVVLAGDHMQLGKKVYSSEARDQKFSLSLLERLYSFYLEHSSHIDPTNPPQILFRKNYRSKEEILEFIASVFYAGKEKLISKSNLPEVAGLSPLRFHTVQGCEQQDADKTSYYNLAEVEEVVSQVTELLSRWPGEWGDVDASQICVLTPYSAQVRFIRDGLRKKKSRELQSVSCHNVHNVPGREFRAVVLSTVRTRHVIETEEKVNDSNLGFLSNPRLVNTALTRTQSLVAVIGDPVALCAIGECSKIWLAYLKKCQSMHSIYPKTITVEIVKELVQNILKSSYGNVLVERAEHVKSSTHFPQMVPVNQTSSPAVPAEPVCNGVWNVPAASSPERRRVHPEQKVPSNSPKLTRENFLDDWEQEYMLEPDDIIQQLAKEDLMLELETAEKEGKALQQEFVVDFSKPLRSNFIRIKEKQGHAVISYRGQWTKAEKKRKLLGADDAGEDYDSDTDKSDDEDCRGREDYSDFTHQQLLGLIHSQPDQYFRCILHSDSRRMYAEVVDKDLIIEEIEISCRQRCGRAFHSDEVVVRVIQSEAAAPVNKTAAVHGEVVGILKRYIDPAYRLFVCTVEPKNSGLMIPLNRGIPKIYNLSNRKNLKKATKGHVCVHKFTKDKTILFDRFVKVDPQDTESQLFVVRFLKWEAKCPYPLGIVVGVIPCGQSVEQSIVILNIEYQIPKKYSKETEELVEELKSMGTQIPKEADGERLDYRSKTVFTIDPPFSKDLDDAISIEQLPGEQYLVGVHIADVSHHVKRDSPIDHEAASRGVSFYPMKNKTIHMLHPYFSTDVCSLVPNTDRLTVTVFFTVSNNGEILQAKPQRCVIKSIRLSYEDVEDILHDHSEANQDLRKRLQALGKLAQIWRYKRLGNAHLSNQMDAESRETPHAHLLVEELMIMTNFQVGKLLIKEFPKSIPLRSQQSPHPAALEQWKEAYAADAANAVALTRPFLQNYATCKCRIACTCVSKFMMTHKLKGPEEVSLSTSTWQAMNLAASENNYSEVQDLIVQAEHHPAQMLALLQLYKIQEKSQYVCSGNAGKEDSGHYSLNLAHYVQFTSPIRRYLDLVIQRMVCAVIDQRPCPYSQADIEELCKRMTYASDQASRYHKACYLVQLAAALKNKPVVVYPLVEDVTEADIKLQMPKLQVPQRQREVSLALLAPSKMPTVDEEENKVCLNWQERVYELPSGNAEKIKVVSANTIHFDSDRFVSKIPVNNWQQLLRAAREPVAGKIADGMQLTSVKKLPSVFRNIRTTVKTPSQEGLFGQDVTSEVGEGKTIVRHSRSFSSEIQKTAVLKVQLSSSMYRGLLVPTLQLLSLTPRLDVCLEHRRNPVSCLATTTTKHASKPSYNDEEAYRAAWLPVLGMESAMTAVAQQDSVIIHNVDIKWHTGTPKVWGEFQLPLSFCKDRQIKYKSFSSDYLCIRYPKLVLPEDQRLAKDVAAVVNNGQSVTWTCHCCVTNTDIKEEDDRVLIKLGLHHSAVPFPAMLCQTEGIRPLCTVEWIPKVLPIRRMEKAVGSLAKQSQLARSIAVGKTPTARVDVLDAQRLSLMSLPGLPTPNKKQLEAITDALRKPFSLIQGPPGTGKTLIGVRLAWLFAKRNRENRTLDTKPQVLYCGPSNKSVDVVANYLKGLKSNLKLVRVYSENIEREEFPVPRDPVPVRRRPSPSSASMDPNLADLAAHHLIRKPSNPYAQQILVYDQMFARWPDSVSDELKENYLKLITTAEVEEIAGADIVLCTCSASSSPRITMGTTTHQVIIDECGMCTEPESMIPIVNARSRQVVLIGDHKQLRPIVLSQQARDLGLETSLFERYADKAIMLTTQYRMHRGIAKFPSDQFYEGKLECGQKVQNQPAALDIWPNGRGNPTALCHVTGSEETLTVTTEEGSEQSKSNQQEAGTAMAIVQALVKHFSVKPSNIMVLSQYRAQVTAIQKMLNQAGLGTAGVSTVVSSQGSEWDYVILSTVRSLPEEEIERQPTEGWKRRHLGFITDDHQINVAITRARKGLFIVGNKHLLNCDPMWRNLIAHYNKEKKVIEEAELMTLLKANRG